MSKKIIVFILTILLTVGASFYLRSKTVSTTMEEQYQNYRRVSFSEIHFAYGAFRGNYLDVYHDVTNIEELVSNSKVIAKVRFIKRQQKYETFYSTVKVLELFKGKLVGDEIVIFETMKISENILYTMSTHKPMEEGQDYIVFLQEAIPEDGKHFNFVNSCLGLIPIKEELHVKKTDEKIGDLSTEMSREEFKKYDFLDIRYNLIDDSSWGEDSDDIRDSISTYDQTKQVFYSQYNALLKKYANVNGKVIFEEN